MRYSRSSAGQMFRAGTAIGAVLLFLLSGMLTGCVRRELTFTGPGMSRMTGTEGAEGDAGTAAVSAGTVSDGNDEEASADDGRMIGTEADAAVTAASSDPDGSQKAGGEGDSETDTGELTETLRIRVHVCGAVMNPGVYELEETARVTDAVAAAGGFADNADRDWCNLAAGLTDGQQLRICTLEETASLRESGVWSASGYTLSDTGGSAGSFADSGVNAASADTGTASGNAGISGADGDTASASNGSGDDTEPVNLNTATAEELMTLPGIGEARAALIVAYRQEHGSFTQVEEIMNIRGIKEALFAQIRERICV